MPTEEQITIFDLRCKKCHVMRNAVGKNNNYCYKADKMIRRNSRACTKFQKVRFMLRGLT